MILWLSFFAVGLLLVALGFVFGIAYGVSRCEADYAERTARIARLARNGQ